MGQRQRQLQTAVEEQTSRLMSRAGLQEIRKAVCLCVRVRVRAIMRFCACVILGLQHRPRACQASSALTSRLPAELLSTHIF